MSYLPNSFVSAYLFLYRHSIVCLGSFELRRRGKRRRGQRINNQDLCPSADIRWNDTMELCLAEHYASQPTHGVSRFSTRKAISSHSAPRIRQRRVFQPLFYHKWRFSVLNFSRIKVSALNGIKALLHSYRFPLRPHEIYELIQVFDVKHKTKASSLSSKWITFN